MKIRQDAHTMSVQFSEEFSESQAASGTIETISVEMAFCKDFQNP
jgi:hypothetical protein